MTGYFLIRFFLLPLLMIEATTASSIAQSPPSPSPINLTVLVDQRLMLPMVPILREYAMHEGTALNLIHTDETQVANQIEQGIDAQLLISATPTLLNALTNRGLSDVAATRPIARAPLALVASTSLAHRLEMPPQLSFATILYAQSNLPIYCPPRSSPEGATIAALLARPEFHKTLAHRAIFLSQTEKIHRILAKKEGFALMLASDALTNPSLTVLDLLPENLAPALTYRAMVLAGESMPQARKFLIYLRSSNAKTIFAHAGLQASP